MCTKFPVAIPGTTPNIPSSQIIIQITATNHNRFLIILNFVYFDFVYTYSVPFLESIDFPLINISQSMYGIRIDN